MHNIYIQIPISWKKSNHNNENSIISSHKENLTKTILCLLFNLCNLSTDLYTIALIQMQLFLPRYYILPYLVFRIY